LADASGAQHQSAQTETPSQGTADQRIHFIFSVDVLLDVSQELPDDRFQNLRELP
jgi:hypothetical protein